MKIENEKFITVGSNISGIATLIKLIKQRKKNAAFLDWDKKLKQNEKRPRGNFFHSKHEKRPTQLRKITLVEPIDLNLDLTFLKGNEGT